MNRGRKSLSIPRQTQAGHAPEQLKVGLHSFGYVAETTEQAVEEFYPGYAVSMTRIGRERGWPPVTRGQFDAQTGPRGAYIIGSPEEVAQKIMRHSEALGGIDRLTFQMDTGALPHEKLMHSIQLMGEKVKPMLSR